METLVTVLPIIINVLLIVLLVISIILLIKCIGIIDKAREVLDDIEDKVNSLNSLFSAVDLINSKIAYVGDWFGTLFERVISKFLNRKKEEYDEEDELKEIIKKEGRK